MKMKASLLIAGAVVAAFALGPEARASVTFPVAFQFSGAGFSGSGTFTLATDTVTGDPANAYAITGVTGTFSDSNLALSDEPFAGVVPIDPIVPTPSGVLGVASFSRYTAATSAGFVSYDNLFYDGNSPIVCDGYPFSGGFLDVYGALLTLNNGDIVDLWSNGDPPATNSFYGLYLLSSTGAVLDNSPIPLGGQDPSGLTASVPEPGSLALLATALLIGALAWRKRPGTSSENPAA